MLVAPAQLAGAHVDRQHLVVEGAVVERSVRNGGGGGRIGAGIEAKHLGPVGDPHPAQHRVASRDPGETVVASRGGVHGALGLKRPAGLARRAVHAVEMLVVAADEHQVAGHHRRGLDLGAGRKAPAGLSRIGVHRVQDAQQITDVHRAARDSRRRLAEPVLFELTGFGFAGPGAIAPGLGAVLEVELHEHARKRGRVNETAGDGGGGLHRKTQRHAPLQFEFVAERRGGDARERGIPAELGPVVTALRGGAGRQRDREEREKESAFHATAER